MPVDWWQKSSRVARINSQSAVKLCRILFDFCYQPADTAGFVIFLTAISAGFAIRVLICG